MSAIRDFPEQIATFWNRSSNSARVGAVVGAVLLLGIVIVVGIWSSQPQYIALASELAPADAAEKVFASKTRRTVLGDHRFMVQHPLISANTLLKNPRMLVGHERSAFSSTANGNPSGGQIGK